MMNQINDMDTLITLHNKGLIDDAAFTKAVKKLNEKAWPMTLPLDTTDKSPLHDVPLISDVSFPQRNIIQTTGGKWTAKDSPYKATFTPEQSDSKLIGLYNPDPYSGSILKPSPTFVRGICRHCGALVNGDEYHDCKQYFGLKQGERKTNTFTGKEFVWGGHAWHDCSEDRPTRITEEEWFNALSEVLEKDAAHTDSVEVKVYSENRTQLPEHAKAMLEKFDEIWGKRVDEYNDSKDKWVRTITKDEDGNEVVEWVEKPPVLKDYPSEVIVEGDDADMNGLRHIFRLDIGEGEC